MYASSIYREENRDSSCLRLLLLMLKGSSRRRVERGAVFEEMNRWRDRSLPDGVDRGGGAAQSILAEARLLIAGLERLLVSLISGRLYLVCLRRRLRATMTGTEDLVTR